MNSVYIEGTLDQLRQVRGIAAVRYLERGLMDVGGDRYRVGGDVEESAIPLIEALGCTVEVVMDQNAIDDHFAQLDAEDDGTEIA